MHTIKCIHRGIRALAEGSICLCIKLRLPPPPKEQNISCPRFEHCLGFSKHIFNLLSLSFPPSRTQWPEGKQNNRPRNLEPSTATWMVESGNLKLGINCSKSAAPFLSSLGVLAFLPPLAIISMKD